MNNLKFAGLITSLAVLAGCSSIQQNEKADVEIIDLNQEVVDTPPVVARQDNIPDWYLNLPEDTEQAIFGSGTGLSSDLQFSIDKALHQAKIVLGDKLSNTVSSQIKTYMTDNTSMGTLVVEETQRVSKSGFKNIDISKYKVINKDVVREADRYRAFILLTIDPAGREIDTKDVVQPVDIQVIESAQQSARQSMDNL